MNWCFGSLITKLLAETLIIQACVHPSSFGETEIPRQQCHKHENEQNFRKRYRIQMAFYGCADVSDKNKLAF